MKLAALVLAAGAGSRFGGGKLEALLRGEPLVSHAIRAARAAPVDRVIVVAAPALPLPDGVETVRIATTALSDSLKAGIAAAGPVDGLFVFLGDMPLVPHGLGRELAALLPQAYAVVPRHAGRPGHPVLLSARALADCGNLRGDEGFGRLLRGRSDLAFLDGADEGAIIDIDRAEDLARLEGEG
ncbi:MAG TPA: NTP transferase domain-containing protein [Novosphingobium sp.]|nr:NTP transferase domain-containing protein [Novosphingobium sp.]